MKRDTKHWMGAAAIAVMMAATPALAAEERSDQDAAKDSAKKSVEKRRDKRGSELERCKKEASGMRGPERGDFMTECLAGEGKK